LDEVALQEAVAPCSGDCRYAVVGAGELPAGCGRDVGITAVIGGVEDGVPEIIGGSERLERYGERLGHGAISTSGFGHAPARGTRLGRRLDRRQDALLRVPGERQKETLRQIAAGGEDGGGLAGGAGGVAREL